MDRLSPLDASFLHLEDDTNHMHLGSVAIFEGPAPSYGALRAMVTGRLPLVPRYRQRIRFVPYGLGRPVWSSDEHFNIDYHLRHTALPSPGTEEQLRNLVGRVMSQKLDLTKPLWEIWVVEGLEGGRWATLAKGHQAMVDGISGTDLMSVLLDDQPDLGVPVPDTWRAAPAPSDARLVGEALADYVLSPYEQWRLAHALLRRPGRRLRRAVLTARGAVSLFGLNRPLPPETSLVGEVGPHRRYGIARVSLDDVRGIRAALGGTVNEVVLTLVTTGFRDLLIAHGEPPERRVLRALVPVSVGDPRAGAYDNKVSARVATLPVHEADPLARLAAVRADFGAIDDSQQAVAAETLTSLSGFTPPLLLTLGTRVAARAARGGGRRFATGTVVTNVPGPKDTRYVLGRPLLEALPYQPIAAPARVGVAVFSYREQLTFGVTADFDTVPDIDVACRGIAAGADELLESVHERADRRLRSPSL